jgi:hypothetical protein
MTWQRDVVTNRGVASRRRCVATTFLITTNAMIPIAAACACMRYLCTRMAACNMTRTRRRHVHAYIIHAAHIATFDFAP